MKNKIKPAEGIVVGDLKVITVAFDGITLNESPLCRGIVNFDEAISQFPATSLHDLHLIYGEKNVTGPLSRGLWETLYRG